jgi:hypothetical protein
VRVIHGDCLDVLPTLPAAAVDAIVTDPPYGLEFMGRGWDGAVPGVAYWAQALRVLKPGGHLLAFGGTRTAHRLAVAVEDAGFEIRDTITWLYGSGFPKSLDVGKAIDKAAGAEREVVGMSARASGIADGNAGPQRRETDHAWASGAAVAAHYPITAPATDAARQWQGWGTALKPSSEPIIVARKPLTGTVAATVLAHGTGALNIDATRVAADAPRPARVPSGRVAPDAVYGGSGTLAGGTKAPDTSQGRWPANVVLTHHPDCADPCTEGCPVAELDAQSGITRDGTAVKAKPGKGGPFGTIGQGTHDPRGYSGQGGASRFFPTFRYQAKAPTKERPKVDGVAHPTVKPLALMAWLVRLVTPPGGTVLDPFAGSGTTGEAAVMEGFNAVLIERDPTYLPLIEQRRTRRQADTSGDQLTLVGG